MQQTHLKIESYGISDIGLVRRNNEDVWSKVPEFNFFALADGMGGHKAGEIAAKETISKLCSLMHLKLSTAQKSLQKEQIAQFISEAIKEANVWVHQLADSEDNYRGMGTTLCCFLLFEQTLIYAHVGDSRIYRFRKILSQMTSDHSLRSELIASGKLKEEFSNEFAYKNVITRAIGTSSHVQPEIAMCPVESGDIYFLCSDGLTDYVKHHEMDAILSSSDNIINTSQLLVEQAKAKGGNDNITIVMVKIFS